MTFNFFPSGAFLNLFLILKSFLTSTLADKGTFSRSDKMSNFRVNFPVYDPQAELEKVPLSASVLVRKDFVIRENLRKVPGGGKI